MNPDIDLQYYQKEIKHYTEMIKTDPKSVGGYYNRAFVYALVNNWKEALADWEKAVRLSPSLNDTLKKYIEHARTILSIKKQG